MPTNKNLLDQFKSLGLIAQMSSEAELTTHLASGSRTVYCGFDPSADSLHVGNLVPLLALRRFQLAGHTPILLVGAATGMIGDPGGRSSERELKSAEQVHNFSAKIQGQASQFLDFDCGKHAAIVVNNAGWTNCLTVIDYLRDIGKHFSVNAMIQKETVKRRLINGDAGISYTEFSYMILQAYDFVTLNRQYGCTIQIGGSDQWGNITSGIDLVRRINGQQSYAMTYPLITNSDGTKFGKSMGNAVWIDAAKTSPYTFYQYWRNAADADVLHYLRVFTFLSQDRLDQIAAAHRQDPGERIAQSALAFEVTKLVHGEQGVQAAESIAQAMFSNQLAELSEGDFKQLALDGLPVSHISITGVKLTDVLVDSGLAMTPRGKVTLGQARKLIQGNGIAVNGKKVTDVEFRFNPDTALYGCYHLVQKGKKDHHLVILDTE